MQSLSASSPACPKGVWPKSWAKLRVSHKSSFRLKNLDKVLAIWATSKEWVILVLKWSPEVFTNTCVLCFSLRKAVEWIILSLSLWKSDLKWVFFSLKNLPFDFKPSSKSWLLYAISSEIDAICASKDVLRENFIFFLN